MRLMDVGSAYELAMSRNRLREILRSDKRLQVQYFDIDGKAQRLEIDGEGDPKFQNDLQPYIRSGIEGAIADIELRLRNMGVEV